VHITPTITSASTVAIVMIPSPRPAKRKRDEHDASTSAAFCPWASINVPWPAPPIMTGLRPSLATVARRQFFENVIYSPQAPCPTAELTCKVCWGAFDLGELGSASAHIGSAAGESEPMPTCTRPIVLSCGHVFCTTCTCQLAACPVCRSTIVGKQRLFFP
jgi:hypothetical protein